MCISFLDFSFFKVTLSFDTVFFGVLQSLAGENGSLFNVVQNSFK